MKAKNTVKLGTRQAKVLEHYREHGCWTGLNINPITLGGLRKELRNAGCILAGRQGVKGSVKILVSPNDYIITRMGEAMPIPRWITRSPIIKGIARSVKEGNLGDLSILADALEDMAFPDQKWLGYIQKLINKKPVLCLPDSLAEFKRIDELEHQANQLFGTNPDASIDQLAALMVALTGDEDLTLQFRRYIRATPEQVLTHYIDNRRYTADTKKHVAQYQYDKEMAKWEFAIRRVWLRIINK